MSPLWEIELCPIRPWEEANSPTPARLVCRPLASTSPRSVRAELPGSRREDAGDDAPSRRQVEQPVVAGVPDQDDELDLAHRSTLDRHPREAGVGDAYVADDLLPSRSMSVQALIVDPAAPNAMGIA